MKDQKPPDTPPPVSAEAFWKQFGFDPITLDGVINRSHLAPDDHRLGTRMPDGLIGFTALKVDGKDIAAVVRSYPVQGMLSISVGPRNFYYFRTDEGSAPVEMPALPSTVLIIRAGDVIPLPERTENVRVASIAEIACIVGGAPPKPAIDPAHPEILNSPLATYSLRGSAAEFERMATEATPLLGELCMSGQATIWYAPPNAGKTLITLKLLIDAVANGRINAANAYYINADDSSAGFAAKMRLMDDIGVHTLAPGFKSLKAENLKDVLFEVASRDKARGTLIILDTVKKFVSLMDKSKSSQFNQVCRQVVMRGGSILGLAHTTKSPNSSGKLRYAGTTDMIDDFDAAYVITPLDADEGRDEKVVLFEALKRRGDNAQNAAYAYVSPKSTFGSMMTGLPSSELAHALSPTSSCWPNQVERFFALLTEKRIKTRGR